MTSAPAQTNGGGATERRASVRPPIPAVFRAALGRRRTFLSQADADAYDAGFSMYPGPPPAESDTPRAHGYWDADDRAHTRDDERKQEASIGADE